MKAPVRSLSVGFFVLLVLGVLLRDDPRRLSNTTFGRVPSGHGALLDWLHALGVPATRSYDRADLLPSRSTVWWIEPRDLCERDGGEASGSALAPFVRGGGTAVVFLGARPALFAVGEETPWQPCAALAGVALPARIRSARLPDPDAEGDDVEESGSSIRTRLQTLSGPLSPRPRALEPQLARFEAAGDWQERARLEGLPFALERRLGEGRLVVVADASFLRNQWLDRADAAPLAADFVRAYGVDFVDERQHGLRLPDRGTLAFLAGSSALPLFVALALLGLATLWRGTAPGPVPPLEPGPGSPTLEQFVASLAGLYARSRDSARLAERYRVLSLARLRRHFGLPPDTPERLLLERLARRGFDQGARARLATTPAPRGPGWLRRTLAEYDALVEEESR